jgi:hypothetical protein
MPRPDGIESLEGVVAAAKPNATVTMPAAWVRNLLLYLREIEGARDGLLAACKQQHDALDTLFAMLIARSPRDDTFHPSKSGPPWEAMLAGHAAIAAATGESP